ncbi:hypothetical protein OROHE_013711 [Orobanche hederae]
MQSIQQTPSNLQSWLPINPSNPNPTIMPHPHTLFTHSNLSSEHPAVSQFPSPFGGRPHRKVCSRVAVLMAMKRRPSCWLLYRGLLLTIERGRRFSGTMSASLRWLMYVELRMWNRSGFLISWSP